MPKIDLSQVPVKTASAYPGALSAKMDGLSQKRVGDAGGITQFGANLITLAPGALSSLRHWHEQQDEFLVIISGELTLVDDAGDTTLIAGDCAAFPAGVANGHHLINNSDEDGLFLVVGTHTDTETCWYSDEDMKVTDANGSSEFTRKDGTPL
ncbi:MAG: cupin domain-containing protein [Paracoccaceae bacterium]